MTLEAAALSPANLKELAIESDKYFKARAAFKKKCKLHKGQPEKHIRGATNFQEGKSELTISVKRLEKLTSSQLGEGIPRRGTFGEAGYREVVDFGEEIGIHVSDAKKTAIIRTRTTIGEIHYNKKGEYHVVPVHPDTLTKLLGKKNG